MLDQLNNKVDPKRLDPKRLNYIDDKICADATAAAVPAAKVGLEFDLFQVPPFYCFKLPDSSPGSVSCSIPLPA